MAEGTYEYECMRAELLGMPKPDEKEWLEKQKERLEHEAEEIEEKTIEELENQNEDLKNVTGGLDELNSILSITQKKINRFKTACGSLTNLLKIKVGTNADSTESIPKDGETEKEDDSEIKPVTGEEVEEEKSDDISKMTAVQNGARKNDMNATIDKQVDKLDALLTKADNAHYSMIHQSKQMKKFLK